MYSDLVNGKPQYNVATAIEIGLPTPEVQFLGNLTKDKRDEIFFSDLWEKTSEGMAIERIMGLEATFHCFLDNDELSTYVITVDDNKMLTGGQGPMLKSNISTMFCGRWREMDKYFEKLAKLIRDKEDYRGFLSIGIVFRDKVPYYRRITLGATISLAINLKRIYGDIAVLFGPNGKEQRDVIHDTFAAQCRTYMLPYDVENNHRVVELLKEVPEAEFDGESYIMSSVGPSIKKAWSNLYTKLDGFERYGVCWRVDGDVQARRVYHELKYRQYI